MSRAATIALPRRHTTRRRSYSSRPAPGIRLSTGSLVDRLLSGSLLIPLVAVLLLGIVFLQVSMLAMNTEIGRDVKRAATLEREVSTLRSEVAGLAGGERVAAMARDAGMVVAPPGSFRFLTARGAGADARAAADGMTAPNPPVPAGSTLPAAPAAAPPAPAATATTPTAPPVAPAATAPAPPATTTSAAPPPAVVAQAPAAETSGGAAAP